MGCGLLESDVASVDGDIDKTELSSLRSSSPKSSSAASSASCTDEVSSIVSDSSDRSAALLLLDLAEDDGAATSASAAETSVTTPDGGSLCGLEDEIEALDMAEYRAEELIAQGADMRHVLCTSWKLQPKMAVGMKLRKAASGGGSRASQQALRDATSAQRKAIVQVEDERFSGRNNGSQGNTFRGRGSGLRCGRPPPGFERRSFDSATLLTEANPASRSGPTPILVSYADGSNTLSLAAEPMVLHDITVSCVADTCHVFLSQMKNPTFAGLEPLEAAMYEAYNMQEEEGAALQLLRPIAAGSLLAVFSDEKWYRCQVVAYHPASDTCDIKFVDHGGYTTVSVSALRPLRSDFVRLPFQTIEVYVAAICSARDEIMIDIAADLLFRKEISVQLLGSAKDGVPVVQIYFYQNDYIHLLTQEIVDDCYRTYLRSHPDHVAILPLKNYVEEEEERSESCCCSDGETTAVGDESGIGTGSEADEDEEEREDWSRQVERWNEADSTLATNVVAVEDKTTVFDETDAVVDYTGDVVNHTDALVDYTGTVVDHTDAVTYVPVYQPEVFDPAAAAHPAYYVPEPCVPVLYYVAADPNGAPCFYPVVAAVPAFYPQPLEGGEFLPVGGEWVEQPCEAVYFHNAEEEAYPESLSEDAYCDRETNVLDQEEEDEQEEVQEVVDEQGVDNVDRDIAQLLSKPYEEWSQADYERFYQYEEDQQH